MLTPDRDLDYEELRRSCTLATSLKARLAAAGIDALCTVLIDDKKVDAEIRTELARELTNYLSDFTTIDYYCYERDLAAYVEPMLALLAPGVRQSQRKAIHRRFAKGLDTLACSVDVAIWHLLRLGILQDTDGVVRPLDAARPYRGSAVAISVLPDYLSDPEETASTRLLKHVHGDRDVREQIITVFFPSGPTNYFSPSELKRTVETTVTGVLTCPQS